MTIAYNPARKNTRSKIFFLRTNTLLRLDRPDAASEPYAPCKLGLTLDRLDKPSMLPKSIPPMHFPSSLPSISVLAPKKKSPSVFFRSTTPAQLVREPPCITSTPTPPPPNGKNSLLGLLCALPVFVQYTLSLLNSSFFVLHSAFSRNISKTDPNNSLLPLPPPCRFVSRACVRIALWFGFRQSGSLDCSEIFFSSYYIICLSLAIVCTTSSRPFLV